MVFQKSNPLVSCVNNALAQMKRTDVLPAGSSRSGSPGRRAHPC